MYNLNQRSGYKINLNNYCMRMEYERMRSEKGYGLGHPTPREEWMAWELEMIERYDPDAHMLNVQRNGEKGFYAESFFGYSKKEEEE